MKNSFFSKQSMVLFSSALAVWGGAMNLSAAETAVVGESPAAIIAQAGKKITVKVSDAGGAIIGANVVVKGTTNGGITDFDGNVELTASKGDVLVISYIGYKTQEVKVRASSTLNVILKEDSEVLNEVVVVGFGTQKKTNVTGAVAVVGGEELSQRPVTSAAQALQGLVPGLQIASSSGTLDSTPSINVRGTGTIGEGSSGAPLILIDGVEGDINTLTSQDIESISVLKDAAASVFMVRARRSALS